MGGEGRWRIVAGRRQDSEVRRLVIEYVQASSEGDSMNSVQDPSSQVWKREAKLQGQRGQGKGTSLY